MKKTSTSLFAGFVLITATLCLLTTGCENNSDTEGDNEDAVFQISPASLTLGSGTNTVILEVIGGRTPFTWTTSDSSLATLSGNEGFSRLVNYTRKGTGIGANTVQVQDDRGWIATAVIVHE